MLITVHMRVEAVLRHEKQGVYDQRGQIGSYSIFEYDYLTYIRVNVDTFPNIVDWLMYDVVKCLWPNPIIKEFGWL